MRRLWFGNDPVDETFFATAPFRLTEVIDIPRPAEEVWADLTSDRPLQWCRIITDITWTSPRPFEVGTTRVVRSLGGTSVLDERFFRWEEGRRKSFYVVRASAPLFRRFAEDYLVEPTSETACRFTWTIATEPRLLARIGNPLNRAILRTLFRDTRRHYSGGPAPERRPTR